MITWSYGVTTIASRVASGVLERTLKSLAKAGFPSPRLFVDGIPNDLLSASLTKLQITCHNPPLKLYGNFHLGLSELFIRDPNVDFYAMFQDDLIACRNLREYLESCEYPKKGYLNLYLCNSSEKPIQGWYPSNQLGKGAVALVFDNEAARSLLKSPRWINRPLAKETQRPWQNIDGGIVSALKQQGYLEYIHNPSLVQHATERSTLGHPNDEARTFISEDFDAMRLSSKKAPAVSTKKPRIGLVGYSTPSGLGELNRQLATYTDIYRWLVRPHTKQKTIEPPEDVDWITCPTGVKVPEFVKSVDIVVFAEVPYYDNLMDTCRKHGCKTVCIPMIEWMPQDLNGWLKQVDLFICPTNQCYEQLSKYVPCTYFPWPVDTERFKFQQRTVCNKFLFINGHGGHKGRKGASVIQEVLKLQPDLPILVYDQTNTFENKLPKIEENFSLYEQGDVLINPHSVDGLGLEAMEAMSCGMPVISTDGKPWNEIPSIALIQSKIIQQKVRRVMDWYLPDPKHLLEICQSLLGKDIAKESLTARKWAESRSWSILAEQFNTAVRGDGKQKKPEIAPKQSLVSKLNPRWDKFLFEEALVALDNIQGTTIVELGVIRDTKPVAQHADGWSTVHWSTSGKQVHSVDNSREALEISRRLVSKGINYHCQDGFEFLQNFEGKIDLLYLDGPDANKGGQEFHLKALQVAPLADTCLVLMDDCDLWPGRWIGRGKGELALPKALEMGFEIIEDNGRQVLLRRYKANGSETPQS